ncbi:hypothetical protein SKAU_G00046630 [Synaphobranchus kaupii]|uniref:Uncharacterized protein n=1 Tax=Synaphobranchus kaupii TaxID=118154 RepID=A0A9Q1G311_SYNKA|nr:hypothetical protein SKAU_G00046630 [Synaphobranchus kaupii]
MLLRDCTFNYLKFERPRFSLSFDLKVAGEFSQSGSMAKSRRFRCADGVAQRERETRSTAVNEVSRSTAL